MKRINKRSVASIAISFSAAALVSLGTALPSFAAPPPDPTTSVALTSGGLTASNSFGTSSPIYMPNFPAVTLNGRVQTPTVTFIFANVVDATGSGDGWNLKLTMSPFTDPNGGAAISLATGSLTVTNTPFVTAVDLSSTPVIGDGAAQIAPLPLHANGITSLLLSPGTAFDGAAGVTLVSAAVNGGMGSYSVSPVDLALKLPATVVIGSTGTYTSTATLSLNSGPV